MKEERISSSASAVTSGGFRQLVLAWLQLRAPLSYRGVYMKQAAPVLTTELARLFAEDFSSLGGSFWETLRDLSKTWNREWTRRVILA